MRSQLELAYVFFFKNYFNTTFLFSRCFRHKTRFFMQKNGQIENAPPGTVVDSEIVHPTEIDSFLLSHKGILVTL